MSPELSQKLRLFIAVTIPEEVKRNVSESVRELAGRLSGIRWTPPENVHLTLKFFGDVEKDLVPAIQDCLDRTAPPHLPLTVDLVGLGAFPGGRYPRVLWAGIGEGREALRGLAEELDRGLAELGFPAESRGYTPHLTLGRVKSTRRPFEPRKLTEEIERRRADSLGSFRVDMIALLKSTLTPRGAIHRVISRHGGGEGNNSLQSGNKQGPGSERSGPKEEV